MSVAYAAARRRAPRALESIAWFGLWCSLAGCAAAAEAAQASAGLYAALTPQDFTAWITAICGAIGAVTAALNGACIAWHRWGRPPAVPRKRKPKPRSEP